MIATSGFLTALECTKFDFGRGSAPDPAGKKGKGKAEHLYSALHGVQTTLERSGMVHTV